MILGIDTASPSCSAALVKASEVIACSHLAEQSAASTDLVRLIDDLCARAGVAVSDAAGVAVNLGPGAFTGLRVGLATAQGLATACRQPLVGCSTFEALVDAAGDWDGLICPFIEARRGEVYAAFYRRHDGQINETMAGMAVTPDALCSLVKEHTLFLGSGVATYSGLLASRLGGLAVCRDLGSDFALAANVAGLGRERLAACTPNNGCRLTPIYIRAADARLPRHKASAAANR
jgi:tRNA threonylcarbamoyladenosine biosynthesis protein TsaB